jgi:hypothetical protein
MGTIGDGSMDRYRYYRSILLVMMTTDSIDPSVKDFFFLIDSINHRSQNPCLTDDHRSIGSLSTDGIDPSVTIFLNEREPSKSSLQQEAAVNKMV